MYASSPKLTLKEFTEDIGALLNFLNEHYVEACNTEIPSFWMMIPLSLDVEFKEGVRDFYLQKEIFSRKILIIAEPPPQEASEMERQKRRAELMMMFSGVLASDQFYQLTTMLSHLDTTSRTQLLDNFKRHQAEQKADK